MSEQEPNPDPISRLFLIFVLVIVFGSWLYDKIPTL